MARKIPYNSAEYIVKDSAGPKNEFQVKLGPTAAAPTFPFIPLPSVCRLSTVQLVIENLRDVCALI